MPPEIAKQRITELMSRARDKRIVVVGDAMLDIYMTGEVERISPEAPVPVVRIRERRHALGGAANVAQNAVAIGCDCSLVTVVGDDKGGALMRDMIGAMGIGSGSLLQVHRPTTQKTRIVARSQQLLRVDEEEDADITGDEAQLLCGLVEDAVKQADALVLEDYNKGVLAHTVIVRAIEAATARGIPIVVDPKFNNFFSYRGATVFKPNRRELESALGATVQLDDANALPQALRRLGVEHLLLTLGEHGMVLISRDGEVGRIPTVAREVYDVVGAGDTVTAYLAAVLAAGGSAMEAAVIANVAAGIEVGKLGAATVSADEVLRYVEEHGLHS
jgi:rfaE bifunctional protein kinase chain/domain